jgi:hypothetical protein
MERAETIKRAMGKLCPMPRPLPANVVIPTLVELRIVARGRTLIEGRPVIRKAPVLVPGLFF